MEKGQKTKTLILQEAKQLFIQKGFCGVSMQDICDALHMSRGGLYRHYGSCQEIMQALLFQMVSKEDQVLEQQMAKQKSARTIVEDLFQHYVEELCTPTSLTLAIYEYNARFHDPIMTTFYEQAKQRWKMLLHYGIAQKEFHSLDIDAFCDELLFAYQGLSMWSSMISIEQPAQRVFEHLRKELFL